MGLLMSDTMLIDPTLDDALRLQEEPGVWVYTLDATCDAYEHDDADPTEWPAHVVPFSAWAADMRQ